MNGISFFALLLDFIFHLCISKSKIKNINKNMLNQKKLKIMAKKNVNGKEVEVTDIPFEEVETVAGATEEVPVAERVQKMDKDEVTAVVSVLEAPLSPKQRQQVEKIKKSINFQNPDALKTYGASETREISELAKKATEGISTQDMEILGPKIQAILSNVRKSRKQKKGLIAKLLAPFQSKVAELKVAHATAESNISTIEKMIVQAEPRSKQNSQILRLLWDKNQEKYADLRLCLIAGEEAVTEERSRLTLARVNTPATDAMGAQVISRQESNLAIFDKRIHDLRISQQLSTLNALKVNMLEKANEAAMENLRGVVQNVLPIWREEIAIDGITEEIKRNADLSKNVSDATNEMLRESATKIQAVVVEIETQAQRSVIDVETIKFVSETHLDTIQKALEIAQEGMDRRIEEKAELELIEKDITSRLLKDPTTDGFFSSKRKRR